MRKTILTPDTEPTALNSEWLDLDQLARVEITSENPAFPIEDALNTNPTTGWRAQGTGPQVIRLLFDQPQSIHRIRLHIVEPDSERMQELALYAQTQSQAYREIRRQQFTFSPGGATQEIEDFTVDLAAVTQLELRIDPDRSHDPAQSRHHATLASLKLA